MLEHGTKRSYGVTQKWRPNLRKLPIFNTVSHAVRETKDASVILSHLLAADAVMEASEGY